MKVNFVLSDVIQKYFIIMKYIINKPVLLVTIN